MNPETFVRVGLGGGGGGGGGGGYRLVHPGVGMVPIKLVFFIFRTYMLLLRFNMDPSRYRLAHPNVGRVYIKPFLQNVYLRLL